MSEYSGTKTSERKGTTTSRTDSYSSRKKKRLQNIKTGGSMMMYIGSASLMMPMVRKAREEQNSIMSTCAMGAGIVLSIGLGGLASDILNKTIDKAVDFWDAVKPSAPARKTEEKDQPAEDEENG